MHYFFLLVASLILTVKIILKIPITLISERFQFGSPWHFHFSLMCFLTQLLPNKTLAFLDPGQIFLFLSSRTNKYRRHSPRDNAEKAKGDGNFNMKTGKTGRKSVAESGIIIL